MLYLLLFILFFCVAIVLFSLQRRVSIAGAVLVVSLVFLFLALRFSEPFSCDGITCPPVFPACNFVAGLKTWKWTTDQSVSFYDVPSTPDPSKHYLYRGRYPYNDFCSLCNTSNEKDWANKLSLFTSDNAKAWICKELITLLTEQTYALSVDSYYEIRIVGDNPPITVDITSFDYDTAKTCDTGIALSPESVMLNLNLIGSVKISNVNFIARLKEDHSVAMTIAQSMTVALDNYPFGLGIVLNRQTPGVPSANDLVLGYVEAGVEWAGFPLITCPLSVDFANTLNGILCYSSSTLNIITELLENIFYTEKLLPVGLSELGIGPDDATAIANLFNLWTTQSTCNNPAQSSAPVALVGANPCHDKIDFYTFTTSMFRTIFSTAFFAINNYPVPLIPPPGTCALNQCPTPVFTNEDTNKCCTSGSDLTTIDLNCLIPTQTVGIPDLWFNIRKYVDVSTGLMFTLPWLLLFHPPPKQKDGESDEDYANQQVNWNQSRLYKNVTSELVRDKNVTLNAYYRDDWCDQSIITKLACYDANKCCNSSSWNNMSECPCIVPISDVPILYNWYDISICGLETVNFDFSNLTMTQIIPCDSLSNFCINNTDYPGTYDIYFRSNQPVSLRLKVFVQSKSDDSNYNMLNYIEDGMTEALFDVTMSFPVLRVQLQNVAIECSEDKTMKLNVKGAATIPGLFQSLDSITDTDPTTNSHYETLMQNMFNVPGTLIAEIVTMAVLITIIYIIIAVAAIPVVGGVVISAVIGVLSNVAILNFVLVILLLVYGKKATNLAGQVPKFFSSSYYQGTARTQIFDAVVSQVQDRMKETLNNILGGLTIPACFPDSKIIENDVGCICRNLCARNWADKLAPWTNASCGQSYQVLQAKNTGVRAPKPQSCVTLPDPSGNPNPAQFDLKYYCMCLEDVSGSFAPNTPCLDASGGNPPGCVVDCNDPLYVQQVDNSTGKSCDFFCQQQVSTVIPGWKGSYCLSARKTSDNTLIPCFLETDEATQCLCYKEDSLYVPNATDQFNIYGQLPSAMRILLLSKGVHVINLINNKYMVNLTDSSGNRVVDGLPLNTQQVLLAQVTSDLPLQHNIYGERSVWNFQYVNATSEPNVFTIQNVFDGGYLTDPNDFLTFDIPNQTIPYILSTTEFKKLTLVDDLPKTEPELYRSQWKVLYQGGAYIFVNVYTNRSILAAEPELLKPKMQATMKNPSLLVESSPGPAALPIGMIGAPGSYLMFDSINEWRIVQAQIMPDTAFVENTTQVYNLTNLAYQDCLSTINFSNIVMKDITLDVSGQKVTIPFPTGNYVAGLPYPANNTVPISQLYVEPISTNVYTIRMLTTTQNLCLVETDGKMALRVVTESPPNMDAQWTILLANNDSNLSVMDRLHIGKYLTTMNTVRNAGSGNYLVHGNMSSATIVDDLSQGISPFIVTPKEAIDMNEHSFLWTFQTTTPLINPINYYRTNIACVDVSGKNVPCNTTSCDAYVASTPYSGVNILNSNVTGSTPRCVTTLEDLLKVYTPGTYDDQAQWQADVHNNIQAGTLPAYSHFTSPCNLYGTTTQFSLLPRDTSGSTYQIQNSDNLCIGIDPSGTRLATVNCSDTTTTLWNIYPANGNAGLFTYASDFLFDKQQYILVCPHDPSNSIYSEGILVYSTVDNTVGLVTNTVASTYFTTIDQEGGTSFSLLEYTKSDPSGGLHENYLSMYTGNYIGCADPTNVSTIDTPGCKSTDGGTNTKIPVTLSSTPFALEFLMIKTNLQGDHNVYGYMIRTQKTYTLNGKNYKGYLYNDGSTPDLVFLLWPFSGTKYSYVYNLDLDMQCLWQTSLQRVVWSFNDARYLSACHSSGNNFIIQNDNQNVCWSVDASTFGESGVPAVNLKSCDASDPSQKFNFQNANFNPQDFPYITMSPS